QDVAPWPLRPGCCGITGPVPSATLDKASRRARREIHVSRYVDGVSSATPDGADSTQGEADGRAAAGAVGAILECNRTAVRFGDLAAEGEADARPVRLGREERHEQVCGVRKAAALVFDLDLDERPRLLPRHRHAAAGFERRVDGVAHEVDERLFELVLIAEQADVVGRSDGDTQ